MVAGVVSVLMRFAGGEVGAIGSLGVMVVAAVIVFDLREVCCGGDDCGEVGNFVEQEWALVERRLCSGDAPTRRVN
jgi:hypothetical protein